MRVSAATATMSDTIASMNRAYSTFRVMRVHRRMTGAGGICNCTAHIAMRLTGFQDGEMEEVVDLVIFTYHSMTFILIRRLRSW